MSFPTDYTKYQEITIDHTKVSAVLTDFPVYIDLSDLDKTTDIFDTCRTDGGDIRVTLSDGTTQLAREIVGIDTTTKTGEIHVKIPSLSSSTDTVIRIWYNGTDTEPLEGSTYGKENTWDSNFVMVQHMNQDPSGTAPQMVDSTSNDNDGTSNGSMTSGDLIDGQVGKALDFDGVDDGINCGDINAVENHDFTISTWMKTDTLTADQDIITKAPSHGTKRPFLVWFDYAVNASYPEVNGGGANAISVLIYDGGTQRWIASSNNSINDTNQHLVEVVYNNTTNFFAIYIDGTLSGSSSSGSSNGIEATTDAIRIARSGGTDLFFNGIIDETRISNTVRSADWISTEYNNQSSPGTFYTASIEITDSAGGTISAVDYGYGSDSVSITVSAAVSDIGAGVDNFGDISASTQITDTAYSSDSVNPLISLSISDSANAVDTVSQILSSLTITDTGAAIDSIAQIIAGVIVSDTGSGADSVSLLSDILKTVSDIGSGSDSISIPSVTLSVSDSGVAADLISSISAALSISDSAAAADIINTIKTQLIQVNDTGSGTDSVSMSVSLTVSDISSATDAVNQILTVLSVSDSGSGADTVVKTDFDLLPNGKVKVTFTMKVPGADFTMKVPGADFSMKVPGANFTIK